jgi:hypothetical protein
MARTRPDLEHPERDDGDATARTRGRKRSRAAPRQRSRLRGGEDTPSKEALAVPAPAEAAAGPKPEGIAAPGGGAGMAGIEAAPAGDAILLLAPPARDEVERPMDEDVRNNVTSRETWMRLGYMVLFGVIFYIGQFVVGLVALVQFCHKLVTGASHARLAVFGDGLGAYYHEVISFLSFRSERIPFPFAPWPTPPAAGGADAAEPEPLRKAG